MAANLLKVILPLVMMPDCVGAAGSVGSVGSVGYVGSVGSVGVVGVVTAEVLLESFTPSMIFTGSEYTYSFASIVVLYHHREPSCFST